MSETSTAAARADAWRTLATATPRLARRRRLWHAALAIVAVPGALWLGVLLWWAARFVREASGEPGMLPFARLALVLGAFHLAAVVVATAPSLRVRAADEAPASRVRALVHRYGERVARLRALRRALVVEIALLAAQTLYVAVTAGHGPRFGLAFSIAVAALWTVAPLERIARASVRVGERLGAEIDV
jgi:hypothetical protein